MNAGESPRKLAEPRGLRLDLDGRLPLAELTAAVNHACDRAEESPAVLVVRLGTARPDERSWPGGAGIQEVNRWERAVRRIERLPSVSVAVVSGNCAGPALDLLLVADYRIATEDLRLLLPVNDGQFWPGMALYRLTNQLGAARARQLVLWGHELTASAALESGLVDEANADVEAAVEAAVLLLGRNAGPELAIRRQLLLEAHTGSYEDCLGAHLAACDRELRRVSAC
ncbi:enoyl-CoA-hydratase DpgB [Streptomyces swartbergensis]|uniref:enoyl-CoA-hydratase DpgB n=1 Tax=Streptomyces swartbergensis TaxID=487165 RepID=UPI00380F9A6E